MVYGILLSSMEEIKLQGEVGSKWARIEGKIVKDKKKQKTALKLTYMWVNNYGSLDISMEPRIYPKFHKDYNENK